MDWLVYNGKKDLINSLGKQDNIFVDRKLNSLKLANISDFSARRRALQLLMKDKKNDTIALAAVYHYYKDGHWLSVQPKGDYNDFVKNILTKEKDGYINHILENNFGVDNAKLFFKKA